MTMQRLVSRIFEESDFAIEFIEHSSVESPGHSMTLETESDPEKGFMVFGSCTTTGIDNYCLAVLLQTIPTDFVTKHIPTYHSALRTHLGERFTPSMIRNFSLIVCLEQDAGVSHEAVTAQLLQIEEDPFDFKKYVLVYSQSEVDELQRAWEPSEMALIEFLNRFLYEEGSFAAYKQQTAPAAYGLVTRLFIKIPFLKLQVKERPFEDLQAVIRGYLGDNLGNLRDRLVHASPEDILNELREMETEQK